MSWHLAKITPTTDSITQVSNLRYTGAAIDDLGEPQISIEKNGRAFKSKGEMMLTRCVWCGTAPLYVAYHDEEWGAPVHDDRKLFEMLILEGAQAGLSWLTILRKRAHYRRAFDDFDPLRVAGYDATRIAELLADPGIVRNRLKVAAAVQIAKAFLAVQVEFASFADYIWRFTGGRPIQNSWQTVADIPAELIIRCRTVLGNSLIR